MAIKIDKYTDPFTYYIYNQIDPGIRATFSPEQVVAIENAIRASRPHQRHPVDVRGVIPLYFIRLYVVILLGRDKRSQTRNRETYRRRKASIGSAVVSVYILLCMILPVLFVMLYLFKSLLGIDLFSGVHLIDIITWMDPR